jgi:hypothetical protein
LDELIVRDFSLSLLRSLMEIINFERRFPLGFSSQEENEGTRKTKIMRRANEIKILDTNERKLKTKSSFSDFPSLLAISFNLNQLSCEFFLCFYVLAKNKSHQKRTGENGSHYFYLLIFCHLPSMLSFETGNLLVKASRFDIFFDVFRLE